MNPPSHCSFDSDSPEHTRDIAARIGRLAYPQLVITLAGDLASGKTCFVQGLAHGLGVPAGTYVTSPSYTLVNTYRGRLTLHHVDLYRLSDGDAADIGLGELMSEPAVTAIEWPQRLLDELPAERLAIAIAYVDETARRLDLTAYGLAPTILLKELQLVT